MPDMDPARPPELVIDPFVPAVGIEARPATEVLVVPFPGPPGQQGPPGDAEDAVTEPQVLQVVNDAVTVHAIDPEPHPAYDDIPSLVLLFENRLV